jgi:hypothetical protein
MISGLEINTYKTEAMWIGSTKNNVSHPYGLKWTSKFMLALGTYFTYDKKQNDKLNFYEKLKQLEKILQLWKIKITKSLYGRINIVKTLGLSTLIYITRPF